jgi:glycosyltransferase involved in cell wall biosynthesis
MSQPTFSVLINNYNYGVFVVEAVESALRQSLPALEIIVVDDGSTDGSAQMLEARYAGHPQVTIAAQENGGQYAAFLTGVSCSRGDVVCFLDADDVWEPAHLQTLAAAYAADADLDFVGTNLRCFGSREGLYYNRISDYDYGLTALPTVFLRRWFGVPTSAVSMRRGLAVRVLDLPTELQRDWHTAADDCLVYGASVHGAHKKYLAAVTVGYRVHNKNVSGVRRSPVAQMRHEHRVQRLLDHHARRAGFRDDSLCLVKSEFSTKPRPSAWELGLYLELVRRAPLSLRQRLEYGVWMRWRFLTTRGAA